MTRKHIWVLWMVAVVMAGCQTESIEEAVKEIGRPTKTVKVPFVNAKLKVPIDYILQTPNQVVKRIEALPIDEQSKTGSIDYYKSLVPNPAKWAMFLDTFDLNSLIIVDKIEYVKMNKDLSVYYMQRLKKELIQNFARENYSVETLETRYMEGANWQMLKFKFSASDVDSLFSFFRTQYIISSHPNTISIMVESDDDDDLAALVKQIEFRQ